MPAERGGWTWLRAPRASSDVVLACLPHAGGGASAFRGWELGLGRHVALAAWTPPGREARVGEPLTDTFGALVEDALGDAPSGDLPLVLYGHSMGALLALELARALAARDAEPALLVAAGHLPPGVPSTTPPRHTLPRDAFVAELRRLGGTPPEVLEQPDLLEVLLPVLRADFAASERHEAAPGPPLSCPLLVLGGRTDPGVPREGLDAWATQSTAPATVRLLPGAHFFVRDSEGALLGLLRDALAALPVAA